PKAHVVERNAPVLELDIFERRRRWSYRRHRLRAHWRFRQRRTREGIDGCEARYVYHDSFFSIYWWKHLPWRQGWVLIPEALAVAARRSKVASGCVWLCTVLVILVRQASSPPESQNRRGSNTPVIER